MLGVRVDADFERSRDLGSGKYVRKAVLCKHPSSIRPTCGSVRDIVTGIAISGLGFTPPFANAPRNGRPGMNHGLKHPPPFVSPLLRHDKLDSPEYRYCY